MNEWCVKTCINVIGTFWFALILIGSLLAAPIPKQLKTKVSDLDRLQGKWLQTSTSHNGQAIQASGADIGTRIEGETISTWTGTSKGFNKHPFTLDTTTTPKRLIVTMEDGSKYNFCFGFDEDGQLNWVEMADDKTKFPSAVEPAKDVYYSETKKVDK